MKDYIIGLFLGLVTGDMLGNNEPHAGIMLLIAIAAGILLMICNFIAKEREYE